MPALTATIEPLGNPIGGLVFSSAFGELAQMHEWTVSRISPNTAPSYPFRGLSVLTVIFAAQNFVSNSEFCIRACKDGPDAPTLCQHIYDTLGCFWNMPGNYSEGLFDQCMGDSGEVSPRALSSR